jgi:cyanate permease
MKTSSPASPGPAATERPVSGSSVPTGRRWTMLAGVWLCYACFGLIATSLAPLVPVIEADLGIRHATMGAVMGAWQLTYIFAALPCGLLLDRIGPRHAIALGTLMIGASAFARSVATNEVELFGAVMLFGLGGPIVSAGAPKVVADLFEDADRGLAMGIYMTGPALGGVVSLTLTHSVLLPSFSGGWRAVLTLWGFVCVGAALAWWLVAAGPLGRPSATTGVRPSQRQVLGELLRMPGMSVLLVMGVALFAFSHGLNNWLPELLRSGGLGLVEAGYWASVPTLVGIGASLVIPRLATADRRHRILLGLSLSALGASVLLHGGTPLTLVPALLLQGVAKATLMTVLVLTLVDRPAIGPARAGAASGLFFSFAEVGGVLGPALLGMLYDATGTFTVGLIALSGLATILTAGAIALASIDGREAVLRKAGSEA